jgi:dihydrodipicolinate synthase/N-acetylneuraminate lyase
VSGLASAWPEVTAELVHRKTDAAGGRVNALRDALRDLSLPAVAKQVLVDKGVLAHADVRPPLRELTDEERTRVAAL